MSNDVFDNILVVLIFAIMLAAFAYLGFLLW